MNHIFVGNLGLDNHVHLDSLLILKATHILLENPQEPVKFYPGLQGVTPTAELQLENTLDDLSVMTQDTCFWSVGSGSTRTIWYGASLGGALCFINNPTLRLLSYLSTYDE